jgi:hypothetical protein
MPIDYSGAGAGKHAYWRNTTKHGVINVGESDFAPGGVFAGLGERRTELAKSGIGFRAFRFGDGGGRIGPQGVWHDTGYVLHRCTEKPGLGGDWWIAFEDTPEGSAEFMELQLDNVHLQAHVFDVTWKDPFKGRDGKHREIRRFGFKGAFAIMALLEDVSENFHRIANGVMDVPSLAKDASEAPRLREENVAKALEIEELKAKIREHEAKSLAAATAAEVAAVSSADVLAPSPRGARRGG